jgi:ankyrin repeat protein
MIAVDRSDTESACLLLRHGSNVNVRNKNGVPALHHALRRISVEDTNEFLTKAIAAGVDCAIADGIGDTALMIAVERLDVESVCLLLHHGSNVNAQNNGGVTALHRALRRFDINLIKELMAKGADPTVIDKRGRSPFAVAIDIGYYSAVLLMLASKDQSGLSYRLSEEDAQATEQFLAPLRKNKDEDLAQEREKLESYSRKRSLAAQRETKSQSRVERLRSSPMVRDRTNALYWAANKGDVNTIHDLIIGVNDANIVLDYRSGQTSLHIAALRGRERVVWHLLAAGADASRKDHTGKTARHHAHCPRIRYLLEDDNWLRHSEVVCTQKGTGKISGERLRDFYYRKTMEEVDLRWGGLLANSEIQPEDFDSFEYV